MQLYLVRHPLPVDAVGTCYGRADLSVAPDTLAAAAASIRTQIPKQVLEEAEIFTSPLSRCRLLACELAAPREPKATEDLLEMSFGRWEGLPWESVPRDELDAWAGDVWRYRPGRGESAAMLARRWRRWSIQVLDSGKAMAVAVTHAGFIRVALACAGGLNAQQFASNFIAFGSVHRIDLHRHRTQVCAVPW
jgi:alpha-ribazole phosphatase